MMHRGLRTASVCLAWFLCGCAGVGVFSTSDPAAKLHDASYLYTQSDRPLIAERLIREAIEIDEKNDDELGLAEAYRVYGHFFQSTTVSRWSNLFKRDGFLDRSATFDTRYAKSVEYLQKSAKLFGAHDRVDKLTNIYLLMALAYMNMNDRDGACQAFERTLENYNETVRRDPSAKFYLPGNAPFEPMITSMKKKNQCM
jgi:tetratricopeptide (TPR) repeat protein